jgi:transcriptional regulator with XRE-family HTH domain
MVFSPGEHVRRTRLAVGWTQEQLASRAGVDRSDLSRIERGEQDPRWSTLEKLMKALGSVVEVSETMAVPSLSPAERRRLRAAADSMPIRTPVEQTSISIKS